MNNVITKKTLTVQEEVIKNLLEELLKIQVNLVKIKSATTQRQMVTALIMALRNKKHNFTYQDLFNVLLSILRRAKSKESMAIGSMVFKLVQDAFKEAKAIAIKEKS